LLPPLIDTSPSASVFHAVVGLVALILVRTRRDVGRTDLFGWWRDAPGWARALYGSTDGAVLGYNICGETLALIWLLSGVGAFAFHAAEASGVIAFWSMIGCASGAAFIWTVRMWRRLRS
jgi:hypothetical protein